MVAACCVAGSCSELLLIWLPWWASSRPREVQGIAQMVPRRCNRQRWRLRSLRWAPLAIRQTLDYAGLSDCLPGSS